LEFEAEEEGVQEPPDPSLGTSSSAMASGKKSDLKRGQHGTYQLLKKVHAIQKIGRMESPWSKIPSSEPSATNAPV